ncbi:MAG TPA: TIGR03857 family LLM class F420-dependent oxidoreductase [Acidimicrobiales bacterium]|nr:TIGR03857 family LLM class F420-dependent oxidoreductase [Acidimicrobiales bacterium]
MTPSVLSDLSAYVISGRVVQSPRPTEHESDARTPAQGVQDGVDAERIGFRRVFLSERWNLKEAGVLLSAIAARTERIEVGSGIITTPARHPLHMAGMVATFQATFGPRFVLGLGRGNPGWFAGAGLTMPTYRGLADYVDILRGLWRGEQVSYAGPLGEFPQLQLEDVHDIQPPPIWFGTLGQPKGAAVAAACFDGVLLPPVFTPAATETIVARLRAECDRIGRDPSTLRIAQSVITAPDLDDLETRALAHARAVTYLDAPGYGEMLVQLNGWDPAVLARLRDHDQFNDMSTAVSDLSFHRTELLGPAALVPDEWMEESCALGAVTTCVDTLRRFRAAGADELVTYGSTPSQNAKLADAWRGERP